jgi:hypothetical protein
MILVTTINGVLSVQKLPCLLVLIWTAMLAPVANAAERVEAIFEDATRIKTGSDRDFHWIGRIG